MAPPIDPMDDAAEGSVFSDADAAAERAANALSPEERSQAILNLILSELDADKAEEVVTIDLDGKSNIADAMVVASGRSQRHVVAMSDKIQRRLKEAGFGRCNIEGAGAGDWVLIDAGDVIAHLFRPEVRKFYNLERVWSEAAHAPVDAEI
ncbi:MAG: ribosome silencing factor [Pseudomonadota bacterium]